MKLLTLSLILALSPLAQADDLSRSGLRVALSKPVQLGDVLLRGTTYTKATARCNLDGTVTIRGGKAAATMPWESVPWDIQRKLGDLRAEVTAAIKRESRFYKSPGSLSVLWGVGKPIREKTICPTVLRWETGDYVIIGHFVGAGAVMFDVARTGGWTPESTEAVLTSMDPAQVWTFDAAASRWNGSGGSRATMVEGRLRVQSSVHLRMIEGTATNRETMGI